MEGLRERAGFAIGRESASQGPDFDRVPGARSFKDESARREDGVIQMWRYEDPTHALIKP
jgi:hypothetical protein